MFRIILPYLTLRTLPQDLAVDASFGMPIRGVVSGIPPYECPKGSSLQFPPNPEEVKEETLLGWRLDSGYV